MKSYYNQRWDSRSVFKPQRFPQNSYYLKHFNRLSENEDVPSFTPTTPRQDQILKTFKVKKVAKLDPAKTHLMPIYRRKEKKEETPMEVETSPIEDDKQLKS